MIMKYYAKKIVYLCQLIFRNLHSLVNIMTDVEQHLGSAT